MHLPPEYKMINNKPMPEAHRKQYNKASDKIQELERDNLLDIADDWRDHRHAIMQMAIIATSTTEAQHNAHA